MNFSSEIFNSDDSDSSYVIVGSGVDSQTFYLSMNIISILWGFPTNIYAIWLTATGTGNRLAGEFFTLNLSVCELLLCVRILLRLIPYTNEITWIILGILDGLTMTGRLVFQCLICIERFLAVVHPVIFLKYKPLRFKVICCVFAWVANSVPSLINMFSRLNFTLYYYYMAQFLFFLSIQLFCCVAVLRALKQSGPGDRKKEKENHMKRRAFQLIVITSLTMVIIYTPYLSTIILVSFGKTVETLSYIAFICFLSGVLVHPLLFIYRAGKLCFVHSQ